MTFASSPSRASRLALLAAATLLGAGAQAQHHHRPAACPSAAQHDFEGHCCGVGEEWVPARARCMCVDGAEVCRQGAAIATGQPVPPPGVATAVAPPPVMPVMPAPPPVVAPPRCPEGMVLIENASFNLGAAAGQAGADRNETPAHRVSIAPYCIDRTEVTAHRYHECLSPQCASPNTVNFPAIPAPQLPAWNQFCNGNRPDRDDHPMNCVDWTQANAYCHSRGGRLPTEAEWEYAARGAESRPFPWGDGAPSGDRANACDAECISLLTRSNLPRPSASFPYNDQVGATAPAGAFVAGASPFGLLDMAGNVMEWTGDWFAPYSAAPAVDPTGAPAGTDRVARGGHWYSSTPAALRTTARVPANPSFRLATLGFRCVQPAAPRP